jgi:hypothetical protein
VGEKKKEDQRLHRKETFRGRGPSDPMGLSPLRPTSTKVTPMEACSKSWAGPKRRDQWTPFGGRGQWRDGPPIPIPMRMGSGMIRMDPP